MEQTKIQVPAEAIEAYNQYIHGHIDRRAFMTRINAIAATSVAATAMIEALTPNYAAAQQVSPTDPRIKTERVTVQSPNGNGSINGLLARPANAGTNKLPSILVVHENRGLNPHIEDITRRLALANYVAFAPDALFSLGGYPGDEDKAREQFGKLDQAKTREDFVAAFEVLKKRPETTGKVGAVGFCYGGGMVNYLATRLGNDLAAGVAFYGSAPDLADVPKIKAPLLIQSAEQDDRINASWPDYEKALQAAKVSYQRFLYPGTQHGFNNDTTPRYDAAAAKLAWERTLAFFEKHLR